MSAGETTCFLLFFGGLYWGILHWWNRQRRTQNPEGKAAAPKPTPPPLPVRAAPVPLPQSTAPEEKTPDDPVAVMAESLEHLLESARQTGIEVPEALEERIRVLREECGKYIASGEKNERLCIAVAGKFSCGKSQFINSLTGCDLAPVDAMRTTCCKTTFTGDPSSESIRVVEASTGREISQEEYRDRAAKRSASANDFIVYLPGPDWKDVALVDTPGFDPPSEEENERHGETRDEQISRKAVREADVVFFLLDITDGTLPEPSKRYLSEIVQKNANSLIYLVFNKADLKDREVWPSIMKGVDTICEENKIRYEYAMPYCSLTETCKELQIDALISRFNVPLTDQMVPRLKQRAESMRNDTLKLANELRGRVWDCMVALGRRKEQIAGGRRRGLQRALLARLENEATTAMKLFGTGIRLLETEATSVDTVDVDEVVAKVLDTLTLKANKWLQTNPLFLKYVSVERNKFRSLSLFCKAYVVCLTEPPVVQEKDFSSTEDALRQVLGEVYPAFVGCEKSVAKLLKNAELVLQSMIPEENGTSITLNDYCEHCDWESEIPDARDKIRNKIQVDFPDLFVSKCSSATRQTIQKAWTEHLEYRRRAIEQKTQPLKNDIATICELLNQQTERT